MQPSHESGFALTGDMLMTDRGLERRHAFVALRDEQIEAFVAPVFGSRAFVTATPLTGGKINSNYKLTLNGAPGTAVLRFYARGRKTCLLERDVLGRVHGTLPAPAVLHDGSEHEIPFLITSWVSGTLLSTALDASQKSHFSLGQNTGSVLANIHAVTFQKSGFFGQGLDIRETFQPGQSALLSFMRPALEGRAAKRLGADLTERLRTLIGWAAPLLDDLPSKASLIHSDFNPPNLMVENGRISGVLDWEFAHTGNPLTDIANMLRPRDYQSPDFDKGFIEAYVDANGPLPANWQSLSRLIDLMSQMEMLSTIEERPNLFHWARTRVIDTVTFVETNLVPR